MYKKINTAKLVKDVVWMAKMLPAFNTRYDELGQENPLVNERVSEIREVIKDLQKVIAATYNASEKIKICTKLNIFETQLQELVELDRNATEQECNHALNALVNTTGLMENIIKNRHV